MEAGNTMRVKYLTSENEEEKPKDDFENLVSKLNIHFNDFQKSDFYCLYI